MSGSATSSEVTTITGGGQAAVTAWNSATNGCGGHIPYLFQWVTSGSMDVSIQINPIAATCANAPRGYITLRPTVGDGTQANAALLIEHELGHQLGLTNSTGCGQDIMGLTAPTNTCTASNVAIVGVDVTQALLWYNSPGSCTASSMSGNVPGDGCIDDGYTCEYDSDCCSDICDDGVCDSGDEGGGGDCTPTGGECDPDDDTCCEGSCVDYTCQSLDPIILDLTGRGYQLTNVANGVTFDFYGTGEPVQMSWTAAGWDGGFLALDRNGNGRIDNATELFSNLTPQPSGKAGNGFLALAAYDLPVNGGNGDGWIDNHDAIFSKLVVWVDKNHNGVSEPGELLTMKQAGIQAISLKYSMNKWKDAFGNTFRYSAQSRTNASPNQIVYDVLLQPGGKATATTAATKQ